MTDSDKLAAITESLERFFKAYGVRVSGTPKPRDDGTWINMIGGMLYIYRLSAGKEYSPHGN